MATAPIPDMHGAGIVLLGGFNPAIFQPAWFEKHELVPEEEITDVANLIILPDLTQFSLDWLQVNVTSDRFQVSSARPESFNLLRDLVIGTFRILSHTPIRAMGVNRDLHFKLNMDRLNEIGHLLAPKSYWQGVLKDPGTKSLVVEGQRPDAHDGYIDVKVEPSVRIQSAIYIGINDHYQFTDAMAEGAEVIDSRAALASIFHEGLILCEVRAGLANSAVVGMLDGAYDPRAPAGS